MKPVIDNVTSEDNFDVPDIEMGVESDGENPMSEKPENNGRDKMSVTDSGDDENVILNSSSDAGEFFEEFQAAANVQEKLDVKNKNDAKRVGNMPKSCKSKF